MYRLVKTGTFVLCVLCAVQLAAQDTTMVYLPAAQHKNNTLTDPKEKLRNEIDSITYRQYLEKNYAALIETSKEAAREGIDFYYLNYRTAIAYYELKNYAQAINFYKKALRETPQDANLNTNLYYAYLQNGQKTEADMLWKENFKKGITTDSLKLPAVNYVGISSGYLISGNTEATNYYQYQYRNMYYGDFKMGFNLSERWKLHTSAQMYNFDFTNYAAGAVTTDLLSQYTFVIGTDYTFNGGWQAGATGALYEIENVNKTANAVNFTSAFSALVFINKRFTYVLPEISLGFSNFGGYNQYQTALQLTYYPLGNVNLYSTTAAGLVYNRDSLQQKQTIFSEKIGTKIVKNLWGEAMISVGNHANYVTNRNFVTYDTFDPIKLIAGATLTYYFTHLNISLSYQYQQREASVYQDLTTVNKKKYDNHFFNLDLIWKF